MKLILPKRTVEIKVNNNKIQKRAGSFFSQAARVGGWINLIYRWAEIVVALVWFGSPQASHDLRSRARPRDLSTQKTLDIAWSGRWFLSAILPSPSLRPSLGHTLWGMGLSSLPSTFVRPSAVLRSLCFYSRKDHGKGWVGADSVCGYCPLNAELSYLFIWTLNFSKNLSEFSLYLSFCFHCSFKNEVVVRLFFLGRDFHFLDLFRFLCIPRSVMIFKKIK